MTRGRLFEFRLGAEIALEALRVWAPPLLGRRIAFFAPGETAWWPNSFDGVHVFVGPPPCVLGDWSGRWREDDTWGLDPIELIARRRRCRPGQALAWVCRAAGVPVEQVILRRAA